MAFLRPPVPDDYVAPIRGDKVVLRPPVTADYSAWAELRAASRAHLTPWEPSWSRDDLTRAMFRRRLRAYSRDVQDDQAYTYFITDAAHEALVGGITLSNVRRGAAQSASLGYWIGVHYAGFGYMQDAVRVLLPHAYGPLRLHRIEAATMPSNAPSIRVLQKSGFQREGCVRSFLKINGHWQDHDLYARLVTDTAEATA